MPETKDLILRQGKEEDWHSLHHNLWSREEPFRYLFSRASADEAAGEKRTAAYTGMHREVDTEFFVEEKDSGQVIGIAGIKELRPGVWTVTDVAIGPAFQGRGYGKQIVDALTALAFQKGAGEIWYECFEENAASKKLAACCSFEYSHTETAELQKDGKTVMLEHYIKIK